MIKLAVKTGNKVVEVEFIIVDAYSPYTTILSRPWLHAMGAISSTLHMKEKYPTEGRVRELVGSQTMAIQCMVATIKHQSPMMDSLVPNDVSQQLTNRSPRIHMRL